MLVVVPVVLILLLAPVIWLVMAYNRLARLRVRCENAYSQIDVQLKRRFDLVPNLVEAVKGYMAHERQTLEAVIRARAAAVDGLRGASGAMHGGVVGMLGQSQEAPPWYTWPARRGTLSRPRRRRERAPGRGSGRQHLAARNP